MIGPGWSGVDKKGVSWVRVRVSGSGSDSPGIRWTVKQQPLSSPGHLGLYPGHCPAILFVPVQNKKLEIEVMTGCSVHL